MALELRGVTLQEQLLIAPFFYIQNPLFTCVIVLVKCKPCALHDQDCAFNSVGAKRSNSALIFSNQHNSMSPHSGDATREQFLNGRYLTTSLFSLWKKNTRQVKIRFQFIFEIGKYFQKINEIDAQKKKP